MQYQFNQVLLVKFTNKIYKLNAKKSKILVYYLIKFHESFIVKFIAYLFTFRLLINSIILLSWHAKKFISSIKLKESNKIKHSFTAKDTKVSNLFFFLRFRFSVLIINQQFVFTFEFLLITINFTFNNNVQIAQLIFYLYQK